MENDRPFPCFHSLVRGQTESVATRNLLILALEPVAEEKIQKAVESRKEAEDVNVHVVAPAAGVGPLQWLTGAEDDARAEADRLAARTADAVDAEVETEVGEHDPLLAVEDALRVFPADEILVAGSADDKAEAALRRLGLPISRLDGREQLAGEEATGAEALARDVAQGRTAETPFVVLSAVSAVILVAVVVITLIAVLIFWLT
jgi:transcriptional regulator of acetoin/glycerol metabolism